MNKCIKITEATRPDAMCVTEIIENISMALKCESLLRTEATTLGTMPTPAPRLLTCVLAPESDPVWLSGAAHSSRSVPSCLWSVLGGPALLRELPGGGWLRFRTWGGKRGASEGEKMGVTQL